MISTLISSQTAATSAPTPTHPHRRTCQKISGVVAIILCSALSGFCYFLTGKSFFTRCSTGSDPLCVSTWLGFQLTFIAIFPFACGLFIAKACHTLDSCGNNHSNV